MWFLEIFSYAKFASKSLPFILLIKSYSLTRGDLVPNHILLPTSTDYLFYVKPCGMEQNIILFSCFAIWIEVYIFVLDLVINGFGFSMDDFGSLW